MDHESAVLNIEDHLERCRFCLASISESDIFYQITETIKQRFEDFTTLSLEIDQQKFSSLICVSCHRNLAKFKAIRDNFISKQSQLYEIVYGKDDERSVENVEFEESYLSESEATIEAEELAEEDVFFDEEVVNPDSEFEESEMTIEFIISDVEDSLRITQDANKCKKILRPKAWNWTIEMEVDLVRYYLKYKKENTSDRSVYAKISKKFESKDYPKISGKSIKYKYEKLLADPEKLNDIRLQAMSPRPVDSDDETSIETEKETISDTKREPIKKIYCAWNEEMEVTLLYLVTRIKLQQPAIADNALFRELTKEMKFEGFSNITENIIYYHFKKLKQDEVKHKRLMVKADELKKQRDEAECKPTTDMWSKSADALLLTYKQKLYEETQTLKPSEVWVSLKQQLENNGYGSFSELSIKNRYISLHMCNSDKELLDFTDKLAQKTKELDLIVDEHKRSAKRQYLFWTEEMKQALISHRNDLQKQTSSGELWTTVAKRMKADGFGTFTAHNVKYKYFNLKRNKLKPLNDQIKNENQDIDE